jgi:YedE family putative selenium metabolism protein
MVGCLMFLGCPFRMILRLAGGDLNALVGLVGFTAGIAAGTFFLNKGYSLGRTYRASKLEGVIWPIIQVILLVLVIAGPAFIFFTEAGAGPGAKHAAIAISLIAGLIVGAIAQRTRLCMVGGIRDMILFRENKLLMGFIAIFVAALVGNLVLTAATGTSYFNLGFEGQPIAHADGLWNFLGMFLVGFACVLLGGCPLRQLVLSGEGNGDSAIAILGLAVGAAFCHNFGLASSADGTTMAGQIAVVLGLVVVIGIACANTFGKEK